MKPSKPSEWMEAKAWELLPKNYIQPDLIEMRLLAVSQFLDLLHEQGKIQMPDNTNEK